MEKTQENRVVETGQSSTKDSHFFFGVRLLIIVVDIIMLINLLVDVNISCGGYLRLWVIGAVLLSFFLFSFIERIQRHLKENKGFFSEINKSGACQKNAPNLFWTVFTLVTIIWCSIIGLILSLMIITIGSFFIVRSKLAKI
ncbi:hypothetical protein PFBG_04289 [Plasmodium falciparum 7G8]|uniref:Uncharacterized protein n=1 Tax=Plasmodium falciparum (isolate 7G8) TaxID=57266 RepID=W7EWP0_PLAF8|nr:hypothetical protein PFBG_04289 [Plasmodium falciparum 7G8]